MGFAIAESLADNGAFVYLITGPTHLTTKNPDVRVINVQTAQDMYEACHQYFPDCKGGILAAAVADFRPKAIASEKLKKDRQAENFYLELERTPDILKSLGTIKNDDQVLTGFSLETKNGEANALSKLKAKNLNIIALNLANQEETGFAKDKNQITLFDNRDNKVELSKKPKSELAKDLVNYLKQYMDHLPVRTWLAYEKFYLFHSDYRSPA